MYYYDAAYLRHYLDHNYDISVYVNGQWLDIADHSDVPLESEGVGYTENGEPVKFNYTEIEEVKVNGVTISTLDKLQKDVDVLKKALEKSDKPDDSEGENDEQGTEEFDVPEEEPAETEEEPAEAETETEEEPNESISNRSDLLEEGSTILVNDINGSVKWVQRNSIGEILEVTYTYYSEKNKGMVTDTTYPGEYKITGI